MRFVFSSEDPIMNIGILFFFVLFCFLLFMAITIVISLFRREKYPKFRPGLSIIVPCYNEEKNIGPCLSSILASDYPKNKYEIIVVDDGSTDRTDEIVKGFVRKNRGVRIRLVKQRHCGKAAGLNKAISLSRNEIIVTIDADTLLERGCLKGLAEPMGREDVGAVNGISLARQPKNLIEKFQQIEYYYNNLVRVGFTRVFDSGVWFFSAAASYRKSLFVGERFFSDTLTEDMDIALRITKKGYKVLTSSSAICHTKAPSSIASLFRQRMRWWFGVLVSLAKNRQVLRKDASLSIWFLYLNQVWWSFYSIFSLPLFIYQILYWLPKAGGEIFWYLFRWFSLLGPFYVLYKIPEWGLSLLNIFGVMSGIMSAALIFISFGVFGKRLDVWDILAVFFYFPYTIILNLVILFSLIRYGSAKEKVFRH
jgi:cellulose synthase/poly-beta-1,6-N-acetylglucosamine synthase-like glycosyltransferase